MTSYQRPENSPFDDRDDDESDSFDNARGVDSGKKLIWKGMSVTELTRHMHELRSALPAIALRDMDVEEAMLLQLHVLTELQTKVLSEEGVSTQHKVQAANAVTKATADLADRQIELYNSERVKRLETAMIKAVREHMPEDAAEAFLSVYERIAIEAGA